MAFCTVLVGRMRVCHPEVVEKHTREQLNCSHVDISTNQQLPCWNLQEEGKP